VSGARGTIIKRGGSWAVVIDRGRDENGKRRRDWHSGYTSRAEAERARTELLRARDRGEYVAPSRLSFGDFLTKRWLPALEAAVTAGRLRPSTAAHYRRLVTAHIAPRLGHVPLRDLTPDLLARLYGDLLEGGRRQAKGGLSPTSVHSVHVTIHRALRDAVRWGLASRNVADLAAADAPHPVRRDVAERSWSPEQLRAFLDAVRDDRLIALWTLAATTGMRRGELCGLRWADVDLPGGRLTVRRTRVVVDHVVVESGPKTAAGCRSIALDPATVRVLQAHRKAQAAERLAWGPAYHPSDLVFTWENGEPLHPDLVRKTFQRLARQAGLPPIPFHGLRHAYASAGLAAGVDLKVMSSRLGHSSVAITADTYQHVREQQDQAAAERVAATIFGA